MRQEAGERRISRRTVLGGLGAMGMTLLAACSKASKRPPLATTTRQTTQATPLATAIRGGRVVTGVFADVDTLQPLTAISASAQIVTPNIYLGLLRDNPDTGALEPGLAERFALSSDGLTVTYSLRDGLVWSDGVPFTGEDYRYTVEAIARSKTAAQKSDFRDVAGFADYATGMTDSISGITIGNNGKTITIKLMQHSCPALRQLAGAGGGILPKHAFLAGWNNKTTDTSTSIDNHPLNNKPPASMGPFVFKGHQPGIDITLAANDRFYRGRPLIDEYLIKIYAGQPAVATALIGGELAFAPFLGAAGTQQVQSANVNRLTFFRGKGGVDSYFFIGWNERSPKAPWLAVKEVRQALWYGLDIKQIIDKVVIYADPVYAHTAQASWAYDGSGLNHYDFDPAKAKALLEQAGASMGSDGVYRWSNGQPMQMRLETIAPLANILQVAQAQYSALGLKISAQVLPPPAFFAKNDPTNLDREGSIMVQGLTIDPDAFDVWDSSQQGKGQLNRFHYASSVVDQAVEAGRNGPDCSTAARKKDYATMDKQLNEDAPVTFLFAPEQALFFDKSLQAFQPKPYSSLSHWNIEKWWIKK